MRYLYIDTSSSFLYTSIIENDNIIDFISEDYGQRLSEVTLPKIVSMFKENSLNPNDIDKIIVVNGPGSFTGIRIGITIAKVFAWSLNIDITTITSLEAMALSSNDDVIHVPIINARRGYVYTAIFDGNKMIMEPQHIKFTDLEERLSNIKSYEFISNDEFDINIKTKQYSPNFLKIIDNFKGKKSINPHLVNPNYLKKTEAEENKE